MSMKVSSTSSGKTISSVRSTSTSSVSSSSFSSLLQGSSSVTENASVSGLSGVSGVEAMLVAQAVGDSVANEERKRRAVSRGENLLDRLDDIRLGLINGRISKEKLIDLAQMLRNRREEGLDEKLSAILDEIELRAEVELAKLTRDV